MEKMTTTSTVLTFIDTERMKLNTSTGTAFPMSDTEVGNTVEKSILEIIW